MRIKAPKKLIFEVGQGTTLYEKVENFDIFGAAFQPPMRRLMWNFAQPSGPRCPSVLQSFTWIGATSRPCGAKNLIFGLWVNLIPAVCRFAASAGKNWGRRWICFAKSAGRCFTPLTEIKHNSVSLRWKFYWNIQLIRGWFWLQLWTVKKFSEPRVSWKYLAKVWKNCEMNKGVCSESSMGAA